MTILTGEKHIIESISEFLGRFDVTDAELVHALDESARKEIIKLENEIRAEKETPPINSAKNARSDLIAEFVGEESVNTLVQKILRSRSREYIHLFNGSYHTIIEIHGETAEDPATDQIKA